MGALDYRWLIKKDIGRCFTNEPMYRHSYYKLGGPADLLVLPERVDHVQTLYKCLHERQVPFVVVGDGSNLIYADQGIRGVVIKLGRCFSRINISKNRIDAEAGAFMPCVAWKAAKNGLRGLEHTAGIPGSIGGLVLMNGGSMGKGIGLNVERVMCVDTAGDLIEMDADACRFDYRRSGLQYSDKILVGVRLRCDSGEPQLIRREMIAIMSSRREKFPLHYPSCGSVFLNDPDMYKAIGPPGKVIEDTGFKGLRIGDAMVPNRHANFIVNVGTAKSTDVLAIVHKVQQGVKERTGFELKCEVRYVSSDCRVMPAHLNTQKD